MEGNYRLSDLGTLGPDGLDGARRVISVRFLTPEWRRRRVGEALFQSTLDFARERDYLKFVIQVRSSNVSAQAFYQRLGFRQCGRLTRQVRIGEQVDDEVIMEFFL